MKFSILLAFIIIGCSTNNNSISTTNNKSYYFDCTVDSKHIRIDFTEPIPSNNQITLGISGNASVESLIAVSAVESACNNSGTYCFLATIGAQGQTTGSYTASTFDLRTTEGANTYDYTYIRLPCPPCDLRGNVTLIISDIQRAVYPNRGTCKGSFSGTVIRITNNTFTGTETLMPISGRFTLPL